MARKPPQALSDNINRPGLPKWAARAAVIIGLVYRFAVQH